MLAQLPNWIVDDETSIRNEVSDWKNMSASERWQIAKLCCRDAMWALRVGGIAQRVLEHKDPMPESSLIALRRLQHQFQLKHG